MKTLLLIIEILISISLVIAILMHSAKGEGLGAIGGGARLFNSQKDVEAGLNKATSILVILFFVIAGVLGVFF